MRMLWIDPERKYELRDIDKFDSILIGGSAGFDIYELKQLISHVRELGMQVYLMPNNSSLITSDVDYLLFVQLMNSRSVYWSSEVLALGAPLIKALGIKTIPTALIVLDPGRIASFIADIKPISVDNIRLIKMHALAAQYLGAELIFLERAGGVPREVVRAVKEEVDVKVAAVGEENEGIADIVVVRR